MSDLFQNNGIPRSSFQIANIFPPIVASHVPFCLDRTECVTGPSCILLNQHHRHVSVLIARSVVKSYPCHVTQPKSPRAAMTNWNEISRWTIDRIRTTRIESRIRGYTDKTIIQDYRRYDLESIISYFVTVFFLSSNSDSIIYIYIYIYICSL